MTRAVHVHVHVNDHVDVHVDLVHDFINTVTDFPLGGFLGVLCVLAVNADTQF